MKRRELFRRSLMGTVGVALTALPLEGAAPPPASREFPAGFDASQELARPDWKPVFLNAHQNETLVALGDLMIPETETPGAGGALVNRFIDKLLFAESPEVQRSFLESLSYLDGESRSRFGEAFVLLSPQDQIELLTLLAFPHELVTWQSNRSDFPGHRHFVNLKDWISRAYYSSEPGMRELGWDGSAMHGEYEGCKHQDPTHK